MKRSVVVNLKPISIFFCVYTRPSLHHLLFDLETVGVCYISTWRKGHYNFGMEIWIQVLFILSQLYLDLNRWCCHYFGFLVSFFARFKSNINTCNKKMWKSLELQLRTSIWQFFNKFHKAKFPPRRYFFVLQLFTW